jgi:hypothetical protein
MYIIYTFWIVQQRWNVDDWVLKFIGMVKQKKVNRIDVLAQSGIGRVLIRHWQRWNTKWWIKKPSVQLVSFLGLALQFPSFEKSMRRWGERKLLYFEVTYCTVVVRNSTTWSSSSSFLVFVTRRHQVLVLSDELQTTRKKPRNIRLPGGVNSARGYANGHFSFHVLRLTSSALRPPVFNYLCWTFLYWDSLTLSSNFV